MKKKIISFLIVFSILGSFALGSATDIMDYGGDSEYDDYNNVSDENSNNDTEGVNDEKIVVALVKSQCIETVLE